MKIWPKIVSELRKVPIGTDPSSTPEFNSLITSEQFLKLREIKEVLSLDDIKDGLVSGGFWDTRFDALLQSLKNNS